MKNFTVTTQIKLLKLLAYLAPDAMVATRDSLFAPSAPTSIKFQIPVLCAPQPITAELVSSLINALQATNAMLPTPVHLTPLAKNAQPEHTVASVLEYFPGALTGLCL